MTKIIKLFVSVIVLVLCVMFCNEVKASSNYSSIYFYSNSQEHYNECHEYIRDLALDYNISSNNIHMVCKPLGLLEDYIWIKYCAGEMDFSNALVIIDMPSGIMENHEPNADPESYFTRRLKVVFSSLKERNCKIMFICGTQEIRFSTPGQPNDSQGNFNEFLDYVDIHINVASFNPFYMSMIVRIEEETNGRDVTLIFDENTQLYDKVMDFYQRKYGNNYLLEEEEQYGSFENYLYNVYNLHIIRYDNIDKIFIDNNYEWSNDVRDLIHNESVYAIGMINSEPNFSEWISQINYAKYNGSYTIWSVFVFNRLGVNISNYNILGPLYYLLEYKYSRYMVEMNNVFFDFINGEDLTPYNNQVGRCQITYCPFLNSNPDSDSESRQGWLTNFEYSEDDNISGYDFGYICIYG